MISIRKIEVHPGSIDVSNFPTPSGMTDVIINDEFSGFTAPLLYLIHGTCLLDTDTIYKMRYSDDTR